MATDLIKQCDSEAAEGAAALKHAGGVVGAQLQAVVNARTLNDEDIAAAVQFREDVSRAYIFPIF